jgi:hypothetical protein
MCLAIALLFQAHIQPPIVLIVNGDDVARDVGVRRLAYRKHLDAVHNLIDIIAYRIADTVGSAPYATVVEGVQIVA